MFILELAFRVADFRVPKRIRVACMHFWFANCDANPDKLFPAHLHAHMYKLEELLLFQNNCLRGNKPEAVVLLGNVKFSHTYTLH